MSAKWKSAGMLVVAGVLFIGCEKQDSAPAVKDAAKAAQDAGAAAVEAGKDVAGAAAAKAGEAATAIADQAQKLLDQVQTYVKDKKWTDAEAVIAKLEGLKAQLPAEWAAKIDDAKKMLATAKSAVGG